MKYFFASDIHGSAFYTKKILEKYKENAADKLILLGDLLYHGPRNDLPKDYSPKEVFVLLNEFKDDIIAVRGNCDSEVDQMVLEFPIQSDYCVGIFNDIYFFITHGHIYSEDRLPKLSKGSAFIYGHVHLPIAKNVDGIYILNPGSASLPKENNPNSYAILDNDIFSIYDFNGNVLKEIKLEKNI